MPETRTNLPTKTRPKITYLHPRPQASTFPPTIPKLMYESRTTATTIPEKKAAASPVEIGTRGTVASLIMKEIEYFSQLELSSRDKPRLHSTDMASTSDYVRPKLGSLVTTSKKKKKKKKKAGSKLIPSMCSMVDVAESNRPNMISGYSYRNLKADVKKLQV